MVRPFPVKITRYTLAPGELWQAAYAITDELTSQQIDTLVEWLCHNCTQNFVLTHHASRIIAGASTAPWHSYTRDKTQPPEYFNETYLIKLYDIDKVAFELAWLTYRTNNGIISL